MIRSKSKNWSGLGLGGLLGEVGPDSALLGKVEVAQVLALLQIVEHELVHLEDTIARGVWLGVRARGWGSGSGWGKV